MSWTKAIQKKIKSLFCLHRVPWMADSSLLSWFGAFNSSSVSVTLVSKCHSDPPSQASKIVICLQVRELTGKRRHTPTGRWWGRGNEDSICRGVDRVRETNKEECTSMRFPGSLLGLSLEETGRKYYPTDSRSQGQGLWPSVEGHSQPMETLKEGSPPHFPCPPVSG